MVTCDKPMASPSLLWWLGMFSFSHGYFPPHAGADVEAREMEEAFRVVHNTC